MEGLWAGAASAVWLGILTSVSPCPLATNVAAMSYIGKSLASPARVLLTGALYTLGRAAAYAVLAALLIGSVLAIPEVSFFLEMYMNKALGPILIVVGIVLLDIVPLRFSASCATEKLEARMRASGLAGASLLGALFAMSFCPVSAALYFGSLIPLAMSRGSALALPAIYGIGTGIPVLAFAILIALGAGHVGKAFNRMVRFEKWARRVTAAIFIAVGVHYCLTYIFEVQI